MAKNVCSKFSNIADKNSIVSNTEFVIPVEKENIDLR